MCKRGLAVIAGLLMIDSAWGAEKTVASADPYTFALYRPEIFNTIDGSALIDRLPVHTFLDGTRLPFSTPLGRMGTAPLDFPSITFAQLSTAPSPARRSNQPDGKDLGTDGKDSEMQFSKLSPVHYGGEVGVFYGQWSGKYSGDVMGTFMQGTVGNDKFQLTVGGSFQESNTRLPRGRR